MPNHSTLTGKDYRRDGGLYYLGSNILHRHRRGPCEALENLKPKESSVRCAELGGKNTFLHFCRIDRIRNTTIFFHERREFGKIRQIDLKWCYVEMVLCGNALEVRTGPISFKNSLYSFQPQKFGTDYHFFCAVVKNIQPANLKI